MASSSTSASWPAAFGHRGNSEVHELAPFGRRTLRGDEEVATQNVGRFLALLELNFALVWRDYEWPGAGTVLPHFDEPFELPTGNRMYVRPKAMPRRRLWEDGRDEGRKDREECVRVHAERNGLCFSC